VQEHRRKDDVVWYDFQQ